MHNDTQYQISRYFIPKSGCLEVNNMHKCLRDTKPNEHFKSPDLKPIKHLCYKLKSADYMCKSKNVNKLEMFKKFSPVLLDLISRCSVHLILLWQSFTIRGSGAYHYGTRNTFNSCN